ncbi:serine/threonine-protein phosphatase, putative [Entamoeba histolytica HM-1:IMSS-B]|uniref:Serine/threonine-protein phosphatase n=7 Tax=Entamoeba histolytica TaxID=5759 RepID=C4LYS6_ENTH1|nr:protein phosphatase, putative [Entamoeba histolytica HM-1:IMSS]EMD43180.1 protein phsophatase, putative [Entamoeba histolytica KU27]EMH75630.1 serine/threonine-protein phosphatase, putative [Entamoeba histolytica HM-1:IMSS-B]EMS16918.1 protein phsophatase-2A, putative [Entamoeba histolytica HM-3:IMSS]ENY61925.1 protein phsophatase-2A, putative [Entamoeba histolytica HM-1:IMSS-A]BAN39243.1 serine/threonine-protein phosphatase, putative [Entamoeba histolytica]|eukprot:XP_654824.1 protein phosphatase, putative [Entamoeba histolytica HM-1:IMSS]
MDIEMMGYGSNESNEPFDIDKVLEKLWNGEPITELNVEDLCDKCREIVCQEGNIISLETPITVCGDIHGQFWDLLQLFEVAGKPPSTKYIFLGDYVDRGFNSVETFLLLVALKVKYPDKIYLIRGNHESRAITQIYGFYDECQRKYGTSNVWKNCTDLFDFLTLGALINNRIFCTHGGLSPMCQNLDDIRKIDRKVEVPHEGVMCDLLWSDPDESGIRWEESPRGAGHLFGEKPLLEFNDKNGLDFVCRAHQLIQDGYKWMFNEKIVTVWSAPNYCYRCGNDACVMNLRSVTDRGFTFFKECPPDQHKLTAKVVVPEFFL